MSERKFRALYCDIGGVLGTNGWDTRLRRRLCEHFKIDFEEIEGRHQLLFDSYERGFLALEDYLRYVFFDRSREFTLDEIRQFTFDQSTAWPENIEFFKRIKQANGLRLGLISNEGEGITEHRMGKFGLRDLADFIIVSHYVHMRKPDRQIWRLALNLAQASPQESIYIDDREMFVNVAAEMGFAAVHHVSLEETRERFARLGLIAA